MPGILDFLLLNHFHLHSAVHSDSDTGEIQGDLAFGESSDVCFRRNMKIRFTCISVKHIMKEIFFFFFGEE